MSATYATDIFTGAVGGIVVGVVAVVSILVVVGIIIVWLYISLTEIGDRTESNWHGISK